VENTQTCDRGIFNITPDRPDLPKSHRQTPKKALIADFDIFSREITCKIKQTEPEPNQDISTEGYYSIYRIFLLK
jgi:hypothetical protein